jgi:hypothetical protein
MDDVRLYLINARRADELREAARDRMMAQGHKARRTNGEAARRSARRLFLDRVGWSLRGTVS